MAHITRSGSELVNTCHAQLTKPPSAQSSWGRSPGPEPVTDGRAEREGGQGTDSVGHAIHPRAVGVRKRRVAARSSWSIPTQADGGCSRRRTPSQLSACIRATTPVGPSEWSAGKKGHPPPFNGLPGSSEEAYRIGSPRARRPSRRTLPAHRRQPRSRRCDLRDRYRHTRGHRYRLRPLGRTATPYTARAELKLLVFRGAIFVDGALTTTAEIENFPGFPEGIDGPDRMTNMQAPTEEFGAEIVEDELARSFP